MRKLVLTFIAVFAQASLSECANKPNIVIIMADDMGSYDASFRGSNQFLTPNIDALGYHGIFFDRFYTPHMCTPSRSSMMTGKYPHNIGMQNWVIPGNEAWALGLDVKLMSNYFKEAGYKTCLVGKWHLGFYKRQHTPTYRGFDEFYGYYNGLIDYYNYTYVQPLPAGQQYVGYDFRSDIEVYKGMKNGAYATYLFNDEAIRLIKNHKSDKKPLFLMLNHVAPHTGNDYDPMQAPKEEKDKFKYIANANRSALAAMISKLDQSVGKVVEALNEKGILENTIILFYSDNGAPSAGLFANHGSNYPFRGQKNSPWEGATRNLGLIYSPLIKSRQRVYAGNFHTADILPTLASAAGIKIGTVDGYDQWAAMVEGGESPRKEVITTLDNVEGFSSIISNNWKLVNGTTLNGLYDGFLGEVENFTLSPVTYSSAVLSSTVSKILSNIKSPGTCLNATLINQMRKKLTTNCNVAKNPYIECKPLEAPCLYNIVADPCELKNVADVYPQTVKNLVLRMKDVARTAVPSRRVPVNDPQCNPELHLGTWTWWMADSV